MHAGLHTDGYTPRMDLFRLYIMNYLLFTNKQNPGTSNENREGFPDIFNAVCECEKSKISWTSGYIDPFKIRDSFNMELKIFFTDDIRLQLPRQTDKLVSERGKSNQGYNFRRICSLG